MCRIRDITKEVAAAVIKEAIEEDLAEGYRDIDSRELCRLNQVFLIMLIYLTFDFFWGVFVYVCVRMCVCLGSGGEVGVALLLLSLE